MDKAAPGRTCPASYGYGAAALRSAPSLRVETLWVAGGVYGNPFALQALLEMHAREPGSTALVLNGDFHWFDIDAGVFAQIEALAARHPCLRGNVETELADPAQGAGCGCGYPEWVGEETVSWSNAIMEKLKEAANAHPRAVRRLASLPMHAVAEVAGERVAVVHGDADSLAGWGFSQEVLATDAGRAAAARAFDAAGARIFASSHSCLPVLQSFEHDRVVVNNGAAGMPNFRGAPYGVVTRISPRPSKAPLYGLRAGALYVEAVALEYDYAAWRRAFLALWPQGSAAHRSYHARIVRGPDYLLEQALRPAVRAASALPA